MLFNLSNSVSQKNSSEAMHNRIRNGMGTCDVSNTLNFSIDGEESARGLFYDTFDRVLIVGILPVIMALNLFTNVSFLFVVARVPRMQTVTNLYLIQLAVADILFLFLTETEKLVYYTASHIALDVTVAGFAGSVAVYFFIQLLHTETMILVTVVAMEKYYAIFKPLHFRAHWSRGNRGRAIKVSIGTWMLAAVVVSVVGPWVSEYMLTCIVWPEESEFADIKDHIYTLKIVPGTVTAYELVTVPMRDSLWYTITFVVIASANVVLFIRIVRALNLRVMPIAPQNAVLEARIMQTRNQVAWMLVVSGVIFFVLMAPRKFYDLARSIAVSGDRDVLDHHQRSIILNVFNIMMYLNSAVNPIVYNVVSRRYRRAFRTAFTFKRRPTMFSN